MEKLTIKLLFKIMKKLLFLIPIFLISEKVYAYNFGDTAIYLNYEYILNFFLNETNKAICGFLIFFFVFAIAYSMQISILPIIANLVGEVKNYDTKKPKRKEKIKGYVMKLTGHDISNLEINISKFDLYSKLFFYPVTVFLWLIFINNYISYIAIILICILCYSFFRLLNTIIIDKPKYQ